MLILSLGSVAIAAGAPIAISKLMRKSRSLEALQAQIDERLHDRVCALCAQAEFSDAEAYAEIVAAGGMRHLVTQAGLMISIFTLLQEKGLAVDVAEIDATVRGIGTLAKFQMRKILRPEMHAAGIAALFAQCAAIWARIEVDLWCSTAI